MARKIAMVALCNTTDEKYNRVAKGKSFYVSSKAEADRRVKNNTAAIREKKTDGEKTKPTDDSAGSGEDVTGS